MAEVAAEEDLRRAVHERLELEAGGAGSGVAVPAGRVVADVGGDLRDGERVAEVDERHAGRVRGLRREEHVVGLDVRVDDAAVLQEQHRAAEVEGHLTDLADGEPRRPDEARLRGGTGRALRLRPEVVDGAAVEVEDEAEVVVLNEAVVEPRDGLERAAVRAARLRLELAQHLRLALPDAAVGRHHALHRHVPLLPAILIPCLVDRGEGAPANLCHHAVPSAEKRAPRRPRRRFTVRPVEGPLQVERERAQRGRLLLQVPHGPEALECAVVPVDVRLHGARPTARRARAGRPAAESTGAGAYFDDRYRWRRTVVQYHGYGSTVLGGTVLPCREPRTRGPQESESMVGPHAQHAQSSTFPVWGFSIPPVNLPGHAGLPAFVHTLFWGLGPAFPPCRGPNLPCSVQWGLPGYASAGRQMLYCPSICHSRT